MGKKEYDFSGWATKFNIKCADGRTIRESAFKQNDGKIIPLVYMHDHFDPENVLGHALLEYRPPEGIYAYGKFNNTPRGQHAKEMVRNDDVVSLSIYADQLKEDKNTGDVFHGAIKELSLVLAGANPEARIDMPYISHGDGELFEAEIYCGEQDFELYHSDEQPPESITSKEDDEVEDDRTVQDVLDEMDDETTAVVDYLLKQKEAEIRAEYEEYEDEDDEIEEPEEYEEDEDEEIEESTDEEEEDEMKHNAFDSETKGGAFLSHADMEMIFKDAKSCGSLREAVEQHLESGVLAHSLPHPIPTDGMVGPSPDTADQTYGVRDLDMLFPEAKNLNNPPEFIKRDTTWVDVVMNGVHHTPFSRVKSTYANITEDEARAKGYMKGNKKKEEVFTLLKRKTEPQTVYKKQALDRDDITDITDFDVVAWIKGEMRMMFNEELARAFLIGDGRAEDSDDKIKEDRIRPIAKDVDLFNVKVNVEVSANAKPSELAKKFIDEVIRNRKFYKGSGNPKMFITADLLTEMLLLEDGINHKLYKSVSELATALRVSEIIEVEVLEGQKINGNDLCAIIVNLADYNVGADKGGAVSLFDDFDIDYNQYKYLMESRCSGALVKPFSAMTITSSVKS